MQLLKNNLPYNDENPGAIIIFVTLDFTREFVKSL